MSFKFGCSFYTQDKKKKLLQVKHSHYKRGSVVSQMVGLAIVVLVLVSSSEFDPYMFENCDKQLFSLSIHLGIIFSINWFWKLLKMPIRIYQQLSLHFQFSCFMQPAVQNPVISNLTSQKSEEISKFSYFLVLEPEHVCHFALKRLQSIKIIVDEFSDDQLFQLCCVFSIDKLLRRKACWVEISFCPLMFSGGSCLAVVYIVIYTRFLVVNLFFMSVIH